MTTRASKGAPLSAAEYDAGLGFSTVAALLADTLTTHSTGEILRAENYRYRVVTTGQHLTTAGGVKLAVMPDSDGLYPFGAWGALTTDSSIHTKLSAAMNAVNGLRMPSGTYTLTSHVFKTSDSEFIWEGDGTTLVLNGGNITIQSDTATQSSFILAANIGRGAISFTVTSAAAAVVGRAIYFYANVPIETTWGTQKREMRRIEAVDTGSNTITVDAPFDFPWNTSDSGLIVYQRSTIETHVRGINFNVPIGGDSGPFHLDVRFSRDSTIEHCNFTGPAYQWLGVIWSDPLTVAWADRLHIGYCKFTNARYAPYIAEASRHCLIHHCVGEGIRHMDSNTWAQDTVWEDNVGINTQVLIECHPSIRSTWRRCRDQVADGQVVLHGLNVRSLGVLVEDCTVVNLQAVATGVGADQQSLTMTAGWETFPKNFNKAFIRVKTDIAVLGAYQADRIDIIDCDLPGIQVLNTGNSSFNNLYISPGTRVRVAGATTIAWDDPESRGPVNIAAIDQGTYREVRYAANPAIGGDPKAHFIASIYTEAAASATTFARPVRIYPRLGSNGVGGTRQCEVIVRAITAIGFAETHYRVTYGTSVAAPVALTNLNYNYGSVTAAISTQVHDLTNVTKLNQWWGFTIDVTVPASTVLYNVELEVIERRASAYA